MPRFPQISQFAESVAGAVYSGVAQRADPTAAEYFPLHVGDNRRRSPPGCAPSELSQHPNDHQYTSTTGLPELRQALAERALRQTGVEIEADQVLVTASATAGLHSTVETLVAPGEEVLLLAPYWPLIEGMVRSRGAEPVIVDTQELEHADAFREAIRAAINPKTVALYFASPGNPTGRVFDDDVLDAIVEATAEAELWLLADDVYDCYSYARPHCSLLGRAPERTVIAYSASKTYAMAGNRCAWLIGATSALEAIHRIGTHTWYSAPTLSQRSLLEALRSGDEWLRSTRDDYQRLGESCAAKLGIAAPEGGTFLWIDCSRSLDDRGLQGLLEDCADRGLLVAPGPSFGPYPHHVRLCFTCASPDVTHRGVDVLASLLEPSGASK